MAVFSKTDFRWSWTVSGDMCSDGDGIVWQRDDQ
jgi:hypothetical protein